MKPAGEHDDQDENLHREQPSTGQQEQQKQQKQAMTQAQKDAAKEREQTGGYQ